MAFLSYRSLMRGVSERASTGSSQNERCSLLRRHFLGIGIAGCRRPGQFDERHDPPASTVKLADDKTLLFDVGQQTPRTAQPVRAIGASNRGIARTGPTLLRGAGDHHKDTLHVLGQN